jgi:hypothetical protein
MHLERASSERVFVLMTSSKTQYSEFAEECLRLAKQAKDEHQREILKEMAQAWNKLAEDADKKK